MFQISLPIPLVVAILVLTGLVACSTPPHTQMVTRTVTEERACTQMRDWLLAQQEVSALDVEEVALKLTNFGSPTGSDQLFYFGLLNQQLDVFTNWAVARDAFRKLAADDSLTWEQQRLAAVLERYNQSRINWHQQHRRLEEEKKLLEQKIHAITELETTISTRKEQ